jgi:hypothetical protein
VRNHTRLALGAAFALALSASPAATAAQANQAEFVLTVHLGGVTLGTIGFKSQFQNEGYSAVTKLKTGGVLNSFYAASIEASSTGFVKGGQIAPASYNSMYTGEKSTQRVQLAYAATGISLDSEPAYDVKRFPVTDDQKKNTVDPISAMVQAVSGVTLSEGNPCGDTLRIFDGKRRFDVELTLVEETELSSTNGGYSGKATLCDAKYVQVAGFKQELTRKEPPPVQIWLAKFPAAPGGPLKTLAVPVKIQSETPYGMAVANARNIVVDGKKVGG